MERPSTSAGTSPEARATYNLSAYDPSLGDDYSLSYE
jgi:hypothetical protein